MNSYQITDSGWVMACRAILLRVAFLIPDETPDAPLVLTSSVLRDLGWTMDRVVAQMISLGIAADLEADLRAIEEAEAYSESPCPSSDPDLWPTFKVMRVIDAGIHLGVLREGPRSFGARSIRLSGF